MALVEENTKRQNSKGTDTEEKDNMEKLAETSEFDIRSSIGQVFTRAHAKGTKGYNAYIYCKGWEEKRKFRKPWCMDKFKDYLHSKNQSKAWSFVDETIGSSMTLVAIVQHFGGWAWAPAVQGARNVAAKCSMMGGKWVKMDDFPDCTTSWSSSRPTGTSS